MQAYDSRTTAFRLILVLLGVWVGSAQAQELCGIDSIFADGLEAAGFVPITQVAGGISSPGLTTDIIGSGTLSVAITSPGTGSTTGDATVDVFGSYSGPVNTGIAVNNITGYVANGQFLIPNVPLVAGANTLSIQATTLPGSTATASSSVSQSGTASLVSVQADHAIGFAPFNVGFRYAVGTLPLSATVQSIAVNFHSTGTDDYSGPLSGAPSSFTYTQPGLYKARIVITDSNSQTYTAYRSVLIQDLAAQRGMLCDVYGYVKDRLTAQDATGASNAYQSMVRTDFLNYFTGLGASMPSTAQNLGVVVDGQLGIGFADLLILRDDTVAQTRSGFPMRMTQSTDGVWRISEM